MSTFKTVSIARMNIFWTPASSESTHSIIVHKMVILPTPIKTGMEPGNSGYRAFPGNESSSGKSFAETQVASEVSRQSAQVHS